MLEFQSKIWTAEQTLLTKMLDLQSKSIGQVVPRVFKADKVDLYFIKVFILNLSRKMSYFSNVSMYMPVL